jgi:hypothetical protein
MNKELKTIATLKLKKVTEHHPEVHTRWIWVATKPLELLAKVIFLKVSGMRALTDAAREWS